MADITMCHGDGCDKKDTCYRFTAAKGIRQAWFLEVPLKVKVDGQDCSYYWPGYTSEIGVQEIG